MPSHTASRSTAFASRVTAPEQRLLKFATVLVALAVVSAFAVAIVVARLVSRPIEALTAAATQLAAGRRDVRVPIVELVP